MKKALIVLMESVFLSASLSIALGAEMAKEGESNIKSAMSFTAVIRCKKPVEPDNVIHNLLILLVGLEGLEPSAN